jgi:ketosteroid isomerase-like protein
MPSTETLERFILRVEQNDHAGAVEEFYMPDASLQENQSAPRIGRDTQIKRERDLLTKARTITSHCVRPVFVGRDRVVIRWQFKFDWLDGTVTRMEEIAYQRWEDERIAEERFFYDPAQRRPIANPVRSEA